MNSNMAALHAQLQVKYVSLPPGAGKTTAAIEMMRRHITGKLRLQNPPPPKFIFYVAATKYLLNQTVTSLIAQVEKKHPKRVESLLSKIRIAHSTIKSPIKDRTSTHRSKIVTVRAQVQNILDSRSNDGLSEQPFSAGSILFITHEAFLLLSQQHVTKYAETIVLFDEARKWADMTSTLRLDERAMDYFNKLFKIKTVKDRRTGLVAKGINELAARKFPENQKVKALEGCGKDAARAFKELDELHTALTIRSGVPARMCAYAFFKKRTDRTKVPYTAMLQVRLPSHPFIGFLDTYILSADFETSQMHSFFKAEGTRVISKSRWFMDAFHDDGYDLAISKAVARYKYVDIVALNTDQRPPAISKYQRGGLMIPRQRIQEFGDLFAQWEMNGSDVLDCIDRVQHPLLYSPSAVDIARVRSLEKLGAQTNMLRWLVEKSHKVVIWWRKKNPSSKEALLFLNEEFRDSDIEIDEKLFQQLSHGKTVGDNRWSDSNAVVFLAAINPAPELARLLVAILGYFGYDPHEDYIVDKVLQGTGRGNIRNHKSKDRMLIIVPTEDLALRISERMKGSPEILDRVTERLGNYMSWDSNLYRTAKIEAEDPKRALRNAKRKARREKRKLTVEEKLRERALYQAAYRAKQEGDMGRYTKLEAERDALRFEAD